MASPAPDFYDSKSDCFIAYLYNIGCPKQQREASIQEAVLNAGWGNI